MNTVSNYPYVNTESSDILKSFPQQLLGAIAEKQIEEGKEKELHQLRPKEQLDEELDFTIFTMVIPTYYQMIN